MDRPITLSPIDANVCDPATDFPAEIADLYPKGFRYPVGYLVRSERCTNRTVLEGFRNVLRPFIIQWKADEFIIDPKAPVAVRHLSRDQRDNSILSARRYIQWDGPPDEALQASFDCEDQITFATHLSEAGHHEGALAVIRSLPVPFQKATDALGSLVDSLAALGRYEEALTEVRFLIVADDVPTEYARVLRQIEEANLLILCGRDNEAEALLNHGRSEFRTFYTYYGVRAALALLKGDEAVAKLLILRAGRVDPYHSYKLLWNPLLKALWGFIRQELLNENGEPRLYRQNSEMLRLCYRIQGALLTGRMEYAKNLAEGLILDRVLDWPCTFEVVLCLTGLGYFTSLKTAAGVLPGSYRDEIAFACMIAGYALSPASYKSDELRDALSKTPCSSEARQHFEHLIPFLANRRGQASTESEEMLIGVVSDYWNEAGRERFLLLRHEHAFKALGVLQTRKSRMSFETGKDLLDNVETTQVIDFEGAQAFEDWVERKLRDNADFPQEMLRRKRWDIEFAGFGFLQSLQPIEERTPLLFEAWKRMCDDPRLYFTHGPASSSGIELPFGDRLIQLLSLFYRRR